MSHFVLAFSLLSIAAAGATVLAIYILRHSFTSRLRRNHHLYALTDPSLTRPARLHLHRIEPILSASALLSSWAGYEALGFEVWSDLGDRGNAFLHARLAYHSEHRLALVLIEDVDGGLQGTVIAIAVDGQVNACGHGYVARLDNVAIRWQAGLENTPENCVREVLETTFSVPLRTPSESATARIWRRVYALLADVAIAQGAPTRSQIAEMAEQEGATVPPRILEAAYLHSHNLWRHRMTEAVLDHWRRRNAINSKTWKRLEGRLHVVDDDIEPRDILEMFGGGGKARRYLDRMQNEEHLEGVALYDAMRLRLGNDLQLIGTTRRPVSARIYGLPVLPLPAPTAPLAETEST